MDALAELKARSLKAREYTHEDGECIFTLRTPTRQEVRTVMHEQHLQPADDSGAVVLALLQYHLLARAIVAWTGVRESHVVPGAGSAPLPHSPDAVRLYLDANPEQADAMGAGLLVRIGRRQAAIEADAGN